MTLKTHWLGSFARKVIVCVTKVRDKNFRNEKRYEYKAYVSSHPKVWGSFVLKTLCMVE